MIELPENWEEMTDLEKDIWFHRNALEYIREGEVSGLYDFVSDEVRSAYETFQKEKH